MVILFFFFLVGDFILFFLVSHVSLSSPLARYSMVWAMGCLSAAHIYRLLTDYGGYTMDYTGYIYREDRSRSAVRDSENECLNSAPLHLLPPHSDTFMQLNVQRGSNTVISVFPNTTGH